MTEVADDIQKVSKGDEATDTDTRINVTGNVSAFVQEAVELLKGGKPSVTLCGQSRAMPNVVQCAEEVRHQYGTELHQVITVGQQEIESKLNDTATGEDKESNGPPRKRTVAFLNIMLTDKSYVDKKAIGYQKPLTEEEIEAYNASKDKARHTQVFSVAPARRGRGGRNMRGKGSQGYEKGPGKDINQNNDLNGPGNHGTQNCDGRGGRRGRFNKPRGGGGNAPLEYEEATPHSVEC